MSQDDRRCVRRYTFKLYPNAPQAAALERHRRLHCDLYNALLQQRDEAWRRTGVSLSYYDQCKELTALRAELPEYRALSSDAMAATAQRVERAMQAFFRRAKAGYGRRSGFPRFKPGRTYPGVGYKRHGSGWRYDIGTGRRNGRLYVKDVPGRIKVRGRLPAPARYKTMELLWREERWWLSLVCEMAPRRSAGAEDIEVGFDLIDEFARVKARRNGRHAAGPEAVFAMVDGRITLVSEGHRQPSGAAVPDPRGDRGSNRSRRPSPAGAAVPDPRGDRGNNPGGLTQKLGAAVPDPRGDRGADAVAAGRVEGAAVPDPRGDRGEDLQRAMARCRRGSRRYRELRRIKARREARAARRRREALHRWTTDLCRAAADITAQVPGSLPAATRSGRGDARHHGAAVKLKAQINRHVLGQAPAQATAMLAYKAAEAGIGYREVTAAVPPIAVGGLVVRNHKAIRRIRRTARRYQA